MVVVFASFIGGGQRVIEMGAQVPVLEPIGS